MKFGSPRIPYGMVKTKSVQYQMGLNEEDPQEMMNPGEMVEGENYMVDVRAGYTIFDAYERYDGQPAPSDASFWTLDFNTGTEEIAVGSTVTGATSSATGIVIIVAVVESGTYGGGDAAGYLILTNVSGTFQNGENLQVSAATKAVSTDTANEKEADTDTLYNTYLQAGIEYRRDQIAAVPGDGNVLGVHLYNGVVYAFRDDSGTAKMYKNTASGWSQVSLGSSIKFHTGTIQVQEGDTITGASSAATAVVRRIALYEGTYAAGTGQGIFSVDTVSGTFTADEDLNASADNAATTDGTESGGSLSFDSGGTRELKVGDKVVGGTSAATGTISAIALKAGAWEDGDAAGTLTLTSVTGTWQDNEEIDVANTAAAKATADASTNTLGAAGKYEFINHNFYATQRTYRMYGVNGTGEGFEFDGTYFCPIKTRTKDDDYPTHIARHSFYLLLGFSDGRVANSALGEPLVFNAINGSLEIGVGDQVTGMVSQNESSTVIYSRNRIHILTGTTTSEFALDSYDDGAGAQEWSCQRVGIPWAFDDRGISNIAATDVYGNFTHSTMSEKIQSFVDSKSGTVSCSMRVRSRGQYRIFFTDKSGLSLTFWRNQVRGIVPFKLQDQATCAASEEDTDGTEVLLFGADDGFVYKMNKGTSFDDSEREAFCVLNHSNYGAPGNKKNFKVAHIKVRSGGQSSISVGAAYTYEDTDVPQQDIVSDTVYGSGGRWDRVNWNEFNWGGPLVGRLRRKLGHSGETCALIFYSSSMYDSNYTLEGHTMHFLIRNRLR